MKTNVRIFSLLSSSLLFALAVKSQDPQNKAPLTEVWKPAVRVVAAGPTNVAPPSDAIILFDGKNTSAWEGQDGGPVKWKVADGSMTIAGGTGLIRTKEGFGNCQLHIEWRTPAEVKGDGQLPARWWQKKQANGKRMMWYLWHPCSMQTAW